MTPQEALVAIARERDIDALVAQPEMLRGHLMDYCRGGNRREFNLLVAACQSRVPQGLRAPSSSVLQADRIADLARRMVDDHGIGDEHARWAVGTWALALGVSKAPVADLRPSDPVRPPVPERVPDPAPVADEKSQYMTCKQCGAPLSDHAHFCKACGSPVDQPTSCAQCGSPLEAGARFCEQCGKPSKAPEAPSALLRVDQSGNGDYITIGEAIIASVVPGTVITVKPGIYDEELKIDRDVEIVGDADRARVVVEARLSNAITVMADRAVIRNLTLRASRYQSSAVSVRRGTVVVEGCDLTAVSGHVVLIENKDSDAVVRNCEIRQSQSGAGVYVSEQGQGTIEACMIHGNAGPGVSISTGGKAVVRDCAVRDNRVFGVIVWQRGLGTIEDCVISGNSDGVAMTTGGYALVRNCEIFGGTQNGVAVYDQGEGTIEKCVIYGNAGAGIEIKTGGDPVVRDCGITDNLAGVHVLDQGRGTIENCVIYRSKYSGVEIKTGGNPVVRDCTMRDNVGDGVWIHDQGQGTLTGNTLTGNGRAWDISPSAGNVTRMANTPNA